MPDHSLDRLDGGVSAVTSSSRPKARCLRARHRAVVAAGLIAVAFVVAACGGTGSGSGVAQPTTTSTASAQQDLLKFAQCVRSHGVPDFPDPDSQGGFDPSQISGVQDSPQLKTATAACMGDLPVGASAPTPEVETGLLRFAQCMRSHGEPDFPDPGSTTKPPAGAIDPTSPQFQRATTACQSLLAPSSSGGSSSGRGGG